MRRGHLLLLSGLVVLATACTTTPQDGTKNRDTTVYKYTEDTEPEWIRNGEPLEFEGELWYPKDDVEVLLDEEVLPLGEYRNVPFFVEKIDVRPYDRLYTRFDKKRFRMFQKKTHDSN